MQNFGIYKTNYSCAYTFRQEDELMLLHNNIEFNVYEGSLVKEVHQHVNEWISQVIRLYEGVNRVEFEWMVGPIPLDGDVGGEIITNFQSSILSKGIFYTDSNGRELIKREKDKREDFVSDLSAQHIAGNFYPVTSRIALQDNSHRLVLLTDRSQAGTSLADGQLEMILHRRLLFNDGGGVGEPLNEEQFGKGLIARGKLYLVLNSVENEGSKSERVMEKELSLPFWKFFSSAGKDTKASIQSMPDFNDLPESVHLLTLEAFTENEVLLRLENYLDATEGGSITFNIRHIFDSLNGVEIRETTLDGNLPLSEMKRFKFQASKSGNPPSALEYTTVQFKPLEASKLDEASEFAVLLNPMQIRTFIIKTI